MASLPVVLCQLCSIPANWWTYLWLLALLEESVLTLLTLALLFSHKVVGLGNLVYC